MTLPTLIFHDEARAKIWRGVDALAEAVRVTLGPRGRTVLLDRGQGVPQVVNSGVLVARAVELADPFENLGARLLREVAARTNARAGDGTTTATVLARAMMREGLRHLAAGMNPMDLRRGVDEGVAAVVSDLQARARPCGTIHEIAHVAAISANNDTAIGALLARAIDQVGREGAVEIEEGSGLDSSLEVVEGMQLDRGFLSPYFINHAERSSCVLDEPAILLCDGRLSSLGDVLPLLEEAVKAERPILLVAEDVDGDALATLVINSLNGPLKACAVKAPAFGERRRHILQDIAVMTGARLAGDEQGLALAKLGLDDLGRCRRVEVDRERTTLIGGKGRAEAVAERLGSLRQARQVCTGDDERRQLDERIARLSGGVAVIRVGAATETELRERRIRIEDALHATRAAVEEGVLPGGGVALVRARAAVARLRGTTLDQDCGLRIVEHALAEPLRCIVANAGEEPSTVLRQVEDCGEPAWGYNALTREYGDMMAMGVIDPAKVTRLALLNAASMAGLVLTTDCLVACRSAGFEDAAWHPNPLVHPNATP